MLRRRLLHSADPDAGGSTIGAHHLLHKPLAAQLEVRGDTAVVVISGACDASCHEHLREQLHAAEAAGARHIVVDLTALGFIDSIGLRVLIAAWNRSRNAGHAFSVALAASGQVRRVFELTGVHKIVPVAAPNPA